jgi:hypothetical protein
VTITGGCPSYTVTWTSSGTTIPAGELNPVGVTAGVYTVRVVDSNGCIKTATTTITAQEMRVSLAHTACGKLELTVVGGCGVKSFLWTSPDGQGLIPTDEDQSNLTPGTYSVQVTDENACVKTASYTIDPIKVSFGGSSFGSSWGNSANPPIVGGGWMQSQAGTQLTSGTLQFALYPSDFPVTAYKSMGLTVEPLDGSITGLWGIAMGYNGLSSPYYLITWGATSVLCAAGGGVIGARLLYVPAGASPCDIAQASNGVLLLERAGEMGRTPWVPYAEYELIAHYDTSKNVIRFSVDGNEQLLFSSSFSHGLDSDIPVSLINTGKWGVFTYNQLNIQFRDLVMDTVVTSCPDADWAQIQKPFVGISYCSAQYADVTVDWGDNSVETLYSGSAITQYDANTNSGVLAVDHRYNAIGVYTVNICIGSYSVGTSCDEVKVSITDYFLLHLPYFDQQMYVPGMLVWDVRGTGVNPRLRAELRYKEQEKGVAFVLGSGTYKSGEIHTAPLHNIVPGHYNMHIVLLDSSCEFADTPLDSCVYLNRKCPRPS